MKNQSEKNKVESKQTIYNFPLTDIYNIAIVNQRIDLSSLSTLWQVTVGNKHVKTK
jgi:hypothetical protein